MALLSLSCSLSDEWIQGLSSVVCSDSIAGHILSSFRVSWNFLEAWSWVASGGLHLLVHKNSSINSSQIIFFLIPILCTLLMVFLFYFILLILILLIVIIIYVAAPYLSLSLLNQLHILRLWSAFSNLLTYCHLTQHLFHIYSLF